MPDFDDLYDEDGNRINTDAAENFKQLRSHAKKLEKDLAAQATELEELRTIRAEYTATQRKTQASSLGLTEGQAKVFLKYVGDEDISAESVKAWKLELGLETATASEQAAEFQASDTFSPIQVGGVSPVKDQLTYEQYQTLLALDFRAAAKAVQENRVVGMYKQPE
jgi:hypothetical protein